MPDSSACNDAILAGLRVVELGDSLACSLVGLWLADEGAEVVRIVRRDRCVIDARHEILLARGKLELELDLTLAEDRERLRTLIERADVYVEGLHPSEHAALGLDPAAVRATCNPGLISCHIGAFPKGDPRAELPAYEAVAAAAGYLFHKPIGKPAYHELRVGSVMAALWAADATLAALIARRVLGRGQHVEASLFGASLFAQVLSIVVKSGMPRGFVPLKMVGTPFMGSWLCGDGRYIYLHITLPAHNALILERLDKLGFGDDVAALRRVLSAATRRDPSQVRNIAEAKRIRRIYRRIFLAKTAAEWERLLGEELCCVRVRRVDEWLADSLAAGMHEGVVVHDPELGALMTPGTLVKTSARAPRTKARERCASAEAILGRWVAPSAHAVRLPVAMIPGAEPTPPRPPLAGVRVLDLSRVIAGPCSGRVLAELGADVVSLQSPTQLDWALSFHLVFNAGKRSVTLDLTTTEGKRRLWAIFEQFAPDVVVQNYRNLAVARAVGVGPERLRERFPGLVYAHLNAYGNEGEWAARPGFEQVVQAVCGIQSTYGKKGVPKLYPSPIIDIGCGLAGAFGMLLGLYAQKRTGRGAHVETHLTAVATLFQLDQLAASKSSESQDSTTGTPSGGTTRTRNKESARGRDDAPGARAQREVTAGLIDTRDGRACLAGPRGELARLLAPLDETRTLASAELFSRVARLFKRLTIAEGRARLRTLGIGETVALLALSSPKNAVEDTRRIDPRPHPAVERRLYPGCATPLAFVRAPVSMSLTPLADIDPPAQRGAHTREVLASLGESVPQGFGMSEYPRSKALVPWLWEVARWAYYAWRSGNI